MFLAKQLTWRAAMMFFLYEMRRHYKTVLIGWSVLIVPSLAHRGLEGHWRLAGDWPHLITLYAFCLVLPVLAAVMAMSGWAREREESSLEWLYARSWNSRDLFLLRVGAVVIASAIWILGCLGLYQSSFANFARFADFPREWNLAPEQMLVTGLGLLTLGIGSGFLAAALSSSRSEAMTRWIFGILVLGVIFVFIVTAPLPTKPILYLSGPKLAQTALAAFVWTIGLGFLALAGRAMRHAPGEIRFRSGAAGVALILVVAIVASVGILLQPRQIEAEGLAAVRDLGHGTRLELVQAKHLPTGVYHPVVRGPSGSKVFHQLFVRGDHIFVHQDSGRAMLRSVEGPWHGPSSDWVVVGRDGWFHQLHLDQGSNQDPLGWSTDGHQFAWRTLFGHRLDHHRVGELLIFGPDLKISQVTVQDLPPEDSNPWTATWMDEENLLVTTEPILYTRNNHSRPKWNLRHWWMAINSKGDPITGLRDLPGEGRRLFSPSMAFTPKLDAFQAANPEASHRPGGIFSPAPVSRVGASAYFLLAGGRDGTIVSINPITGELRREVEVDWEPGPFAMWASEKHFVSSGYLSLGTLDGGALVWIARTMPKETVVFARLPLDQQIRRVCFFETSGFGVGGFRGATHDWAIWADAQQTSLYACNVASGATHHLTDLGPLGSWSVDVSADGLLGLDGWIDLDSLSRGALSPRVAKVSLAR